jgi:2-isopropylmalate synthase
MKEQDLPGAGRRIEIYDTTLRDGTQAEGIVFSLEDKLLIAAKLDELGVDFVEGGYPLSNAKDEAFFAEIRRQPLHHSRVVAFGMTCKRGVAPGDDAGLSALKLSEAPVVALVGKCWDMQVQTVLGASLEENLRMVADSVAYLKGLGREVFFDAEHFFDGYRDNPAYSVKVLRTAAEAGASRLVLCDTNGGMLPHQVEEVIAEVLRQSGGPLAFHGHNDTGCGVANSLAAVRAGAVQVQGTMNGFGERAGNADLCAVIPNLALKLGYRVLGEGSLTRLTEVSRYVYEIANLNLPLNQPYVGASSFAHKGGMHVHAVRKDSRCYEHVDPEAVGNSRRIIISELSGASSLLAKSEKLALLNDPVLVKKILKQVQDLENEGFQFETAEASFDLIVRRFLGHYHKFFDLDHYRMVILRANGGKTVSEAIVKVLVNGQTEHCVAEGDGPVNAMDRALRKALRPHYPAIDDVHLVDYRVRVVNPRAATAARVRVAIESRDGQHHWGTIGVSENIIDASWQALVDSIEYKLLREEEKAR